jgi:hypothetical protein
MVEGDQLMETLNPVLAPDAMAVIKRSDP